MFELKKATKKDVEDTIKYNLRVRMIYEDYVTVEAWDYYEACKIAEEKVYDRMCDSMIDSYAEFEEFNPDDYA